MGLHLYLALITMASCSAYPGKAPWRDAVDVFKDGEPVPGLSFPEYSYGFQIPALVNTGFDGTESPVLLAFAQAYVRRQKAPGSREYERLSDGDDGWIDLVLRRSETGGSSWDDHITVLCRNSTLIEQHACQQPTPVVDRVANKVFLLSSLDNWHIRLQESSDLGRTWTPWSEARDLDSSLRKPGWGLVFTGLPGGIQLQAPNPNAGRLVVCSSAYWSGGEMVDGRIVKKGDVLSRYSYSIFSDDHGQTWQMSDKIQPRHTTECSVAQALTGRGDVYMYARIWDKACEGCEGYGRGISRSKDGGRTWDNATLRGLPDTTPDVEGSFASALVTAKDESGKSYNTTCFYTQSPDSAARRNLTMQVSCDEDEPTVWRPGVTVDPGSSSYSSIGVRHMGTGVPKLYSLWAWANNTNISPNQCEGSPGGCVGGIRFAEVGFPPCGATYCP